MKTHTATLSWTSQSHSSPLTPKFALMNSGIVPASAYERDAGLLQALAVESLRIDIGWGATWIGHPSETVGSNGTVDFSPVDDIAKALNKVGVRPYWAYCYVPAPFRDDPESWRSMSADPSAWVSMVESYVQGQAERGIDIGYHEVYNEPDLSDELTGRKVFFDGDRDAYLELYRKTAPAIRRAQPDAKVGGPALGSVPANEDWLEEFLNMVETEHLPIDFVSFHHYGRYTARAAWERAIELLDNRPYFDDVELHLNEYNAFPIIYPPGGAQEHIDLAAAMLAEFERLLSIKRIARVHWAQFQDSGYGLYCGLLDFYGRTKPAYWAFRWYSELSGRRLKCTFDHPGLGAFVTETSTGFDIVMWNRAGVDVEVRLKPSEAARVGRVQSIVDEINVPPATLDLSEAVFLALPANAVLRLTLIREESSN